jgi:hypothetical protein
VGDAIATGISDDDGGDDATIANNNNKDDQEGGGGRRRRLDNKENDDATSIMTGTALDIAVFYLVSWTIQHGHWT